MGALAMGVNRKTAAEFSFFLAVPTMMGATTLELATRHEALSSASGGVGWQEIAIGFAVSFVVALVVIRAFVAYVSRRGFAPFAWYRIVLGAAALAWLSARRSEEHTSELQSLMRISYAVFCLKKKKNSTHKHPK